MPRARAYGQGRRVPKLRAASTSGKSLLAVEAVPAALVLTGTSRSVGLGKSHIGVYTKLELF